MSPFLTELLGALLTAASVITAVHERWTTWLFAAGSAVLYAFVYWEAGLHVSAQIQAIYLISSVYGLHAWRTKGGQPGTEERIKRAGPRVRWGIVGAVGGGTAVLYFLNRGSAGAEHVLWDALLVMTAITAQLLMTRKYVECWWLWIFVNVGYLPMLYFQGLWFTFGVYILLGYYTLRGARDWYRQLNHHSRVPT